MTKINPVFVDGSDSVAGATQRDGLQKTKQKLEAIPILNMKRKADYTSKSPFEAFNHFTQLTLPRSMLSKLVLFRCVLECRAVLMSNNDRGKHTALTLKQNDLVFSLSQRGIRCQ